MATETAATDETWTVTIFISVCFAVLSLAEYFYRKRRQEKIEHNLQAFRAFVPSVAERLLRCLPPSAENDWTLTEHSVWQRDASLVQQSGYLNAVCGAVHCSYKEVLALLQDYKHRPAWDATVHKAEQKAPAENDRMSLSITVKGFPLMPSLTWLDTNVALVCRWAIDDRRQQGWILWQCQERPVGEFLWECVVVKALSPDQSLLVLVSLPTPCLLLPWLSLPDDRLRSLCAFLHFQQLLSSPPVLQTSPSLSEQKADLPDKENKDLLPDQTSGSSQVTLQQNDVSGSVQDDESDREEEDNFINDDDDDEGEDEEEGGEEVEEEEEVVNSPPPVVLTERQQEYLRILEDSYAGLMACYKAGPEEGWQLSGVTKGVKIMKKVGDSSTGPFKPVKGTGRITAPAKLILEWISDTEKVKSWDDMFLEGCIIEAIPPDVEIAHLKYKPIWPTSGRDFCMIGGQRQVEDGFWLAPVRSVTHPKCPEQKNFVRAVLFDGGFVVKAIPGEDGVFEVTYITCVDLKGSLPTMIINYVTEQTPLCVATLRDVVEAAYASQPSPVVAEPELKKLAKKEKPVRRRRRRKAKTNTTSFEEVDQATAAGGSVAKETETETKRESEHMKNKMEKEVTDFQKPLDSEIDSASTATPTLFDLAEIPVAQEVEAAPEDGPVVTAKPLDKVHVLYRTFANDAAAKLLAEVFMASDVDLTTTEPAKPGGWRFDGLEKNLTVLRKDPLTPDTGCFLAKGVFATGLETLWAVLSEDCHQFDLLLKDMQIVEDLSDMQVVYARASGEKCLLKDDRDFCFVQLKRIEPTNKRVIAITSVEHALCPKKDDVVRAQIIASGWCLEPHYDLSLQQTTVTHICQMNLGAGVLEETLNYLCRQQTLVIAQLQERVLAETYTII